MDASLQPFFHPAGIAVLGASHDPVKLGFGVARNLTQSGYTGAIHLVNPRGGALMGRTVFADLADVPDPVDLAVVVVPAAAVPGALRACGARGIHAAIIASGGFREVGEAGAALEQECAQIARELGIRLVGPNCIGLLDTHLPLDTTFLAPPPPTAGDVAFVSHSGAICAAVIDWASGQGFGLSRLVSLGNQTDVCETDVLAPVASDVHTRVLTLYLEGVREGRRFIEQASLVSRDKPIVALKVGRFAAGQRAVASHTGALAGQEAAYNAAFQRAGVIRAETNEEMFDWARALAWCPLPQRREIAILTNAGGPGVVAADAVEALGLPLAAFSDTTLARMRAVLPAAASVHNPVDMLASAGPHEYGECLRALLDDERVGAVMVIMPPPPTHSAESVCEALVPIIRASSKPVVFALMGENLIRRASDVLRAARIPDYRFPERAASALATLVRRAAFVSAPAPVPARRDDVRPAEARAVLDAAADGFLGQDAVARVLGAYGIDLPRIALATTAEDAVTVAAQLGFPVALKVASPDIPHKSDVGGVLLGLGDADTVRAGFATVQANARRAHPTARLDGVHVQRMLPEGQEVIVGAVQDPQFGALVMFGAGGTEVEGVKDVAFALAPLPHAEADAMIDGSWAGRKLRGFRNVPPADRNAAMEVVLRLGQLVADHPDIAEVEINPLRVRPAGEGAVAVDVRLRVSRETR
ncbi:MAG: acetate--CoA ligase family protein [Gemmatimonadota bacterium]|nr:acetate--CoA ligase family protein [Gemmatimonadota bacterium]